MFLFDVCRRRFCNCFLLVMLLLMFLFFFLGMRSTMLSVRLCVLVLLFLMLAVAVFDRLFDVVLYLLIVCFLVASCGLRPSVRLASASPRGCMCPHALSPPLHGPACVRWLGSFMPISQQLFKLA